MKKVNIREGEHNFSVWRDVLIVSYLVIYSQSISFHKDLKQSLEQFNKNLKNFIKLFLINVFFSPISFVFIVICSIFPFVKPQPLDHNFGH